MTARSTRNKLKFQGAAAYADLFNAQSHMVNLAAIADNRSDYISEYLPPLMAGVEMLIKSVQQFNEGL